MIVILLYAFNHDLSSKYREGILKGDNNSTLDWIQLFDHGMQKFILLLFSKYMGYTNDKIML